MIIKKVFKKDVLVQREMALCECPKCGKEFEMFCSQARNQKTCGDCRTYGAEKGSKWPDGGGKNGNNRLYRIWRNMKNRCYMPKAAGYRYYGGRGISIASEWLNSFEKFSDWAKNNGYEDWLTIDRIDVNGNYEPGNCRWITIMEQAKNKTNSAGRQ